MPDPAPGYEWYRELADDLLQMDADTATALAGAP